ncbi:MAG: GNAT family N-acetyltransferase [Eubacteriales bacterium]|nr:GNAT family N-acetyltransferase [Eubacteriales bacterium]
MQWTIRPALPDDLPRLLALYAHLHAQAPQRIADEAVAAAWQAVCADSRQRILLGCADGLPIATLTVVLVPNLTHGGRPYALIENVVTHADFRRRGYGTALLREACAWAARQNCYKVMLMTGRHDQATLRFYQNAGFDPAGKHAFVLKIR